jgi:GT2 family glycosyltransferase
MGAGPQHLFPKAVGPPMKDLLASVVIPVGADASHVAACVERVQAQQFAKKEVIVVCDALTGDLTALPPGSEDFRIIRERRPTPMAGLINAGMRAARGHVKVLLMPHCEPVGDDWLQSMVAPFDDDNVAVVAAQCVPAPGETPGLAARLMDAVDPWQRRAEDSQPANVRTVSHLCDAYRASLLADVGYFDEDNFRTPGEAIDISLKVADAGYAILLAPDAAVACRTPAGRRSLGRALSRAMDYGHVDAALDRLYEMRWLNAGVLAAAAASLLLFPVATVSLPIAVALSLAVIAWGGFLSVRVPVIRWDCPTAAINFAAYVAIILVVRRDWRPEWFGKQIHPAILRQWCLLAAVCGSYVLLLLRSAALTTGQAARTRAGWVWAVPVFALAAVWWLLAGIGYARGRWGSQPRKHGAPAHGLRA